MKPMFLNMSKVKKVAGDKNTSTFKHDDGHTITIAHKALPAIQRKQLEKLPLHLDEGGSVDLSAPETGSMQGGNADAAKENYKKETADKNKYGDAKTTEMCAGGPVKGYDSGGMVDMVAKLAPLALMAEGGAPPSTGGPMAPVPEAQPQTPSGPPPGTDIPVPDAGPATADTAPTAPAPNADRSPASSLPDFGKPVESPKDTSSMPAPADMTGAYNQGQRAISEQQDVNTKQAQANQDIQQADLTARQNLATGVEANKKAFLDHQQAFMQDYAAGKINENHFMENQGATQKVRNAIGLFLGGFGQGLTGGNNPAADYLNAQIDRDIDSQKANLGKKKTLLEANQALYHDQILADNATRINMNDIYDHQVQLAASKLGTAQAKAGADMAHSKFALENSQLLNQNAIRATVLHSAQAGGQGLDAQSLAAAGLMTPEQAEKEQSSLIKQKNSITNVNKLYSQANANNTLSNRVAHPIDSTSEVDRLNGAIANVVLGADASHRLTPETVKIELAPYFVHLKDSNAEVAKKHQGVLDLLKTGAAPTPNMQKYAPSSLPDYTRPSGPGGTQMQHKVGDIVNIKGQGPMQIIDTKGNLRPAK